MIICIVPEDLDGEYNTNFVFRGKAIINPRGFRCYSQTKVLLGDWGAVFAVAGVDRTVRGPTNKSE